MTTPHPQAVVLLSGGLDSATTLAIARSEHFACSTLTFRYGQRHVREVAAAERLARSLGVEHHRVVNLDLGQFGGSALTADIPVPKRSSERGPSAGIPVTYVPARNTVFLALALAYAEVLAAEHIFIGVNAVDYSGYPDCRPEFLSAFERVANLATKSAVEGRPMHIHAPLVSWSKAEIIRRGLRLNVDYALTTSCYDPDARGRACGGCDACVLRLAGFAANGAIDPIAYVDPRARE